MLKGIYLCACKARHPCHDLVYQDIDNSVGCDIGGNALDVDLSPYDYIVATPPCNFWSKANPYWWHSSYAWLTASLLPLLIIKLHKVGKPFVIENVINRSRFDMLGIYDLCRKLNIYVVEVGRHTYFSNRAFELDCPQQQDFSYGGKRVNNDGYNQGGTNVHNCIELWLCQLEQEGQVGALGLAKQKASLERLNQIALVGADQLTLF